MMPKIPMTDDEIRMHKPVSPDFVDFRAGIRCAERVYEVAKILAENDTLRAQLEQAQADAARYRRMLEHEEDATCMVQTMSANFWSESIDAARAALENKT